MIVEVGLVFLNIVTLKVTTVVNSSDLLGKYSYKYL